jgi:hypothetical protein
MNRFIYFFLEERRVRWKVYVTSSGITFIYALVNLFVFHRSESRVAVEAVIVLFLAITICVMTYVIRGEAIGTATQKPQITVPFNWRFAVAGATAAALLVSMHEISIPQLQAAIAGFRLKSLATFLDTVQAANVSDEQVRIRYQEVESIVDKSFKNQIPVNSNLLQETQTAISHSLKNPSLSNRTNQLGWATAIDLESLSYTRKIQTGAIITIPAGEIGSSAAGAYVLRSPVEIDKRNLHFQGAHSRLALREGGMFFITQSDVVFDKIDFWGPSDSPPLWVRDDRSNVLVRDSVMKYVTQILDRITWVDVRFENSRIHYDGGPLRLRNVSFKDCEFEPPLFGPILEELANKIKASEGQPLTFIYEPQSR